MARLGEEGKMQVVAIIDRGMNYCMPPGIEFFYIYVYIVFVDHLSLLLLLLLLLLFWGWMG